MSTFLKVFGIIEFFCVWVEGEKTSNEYTTFRINKMSIFICRYRQSFVLYSLSPGMRAIRNKFLCSKLHFIFTSSFVIAQMDRYYLFMHFSTLKHIQCHCHNHNMARAIITFKRKEKFFWRNTTNINKKIGSRKKEVRCA